MMIVLMVSANVFASSGSGNVTVPVNCVSTLAVNGATRTTNYSYVSVKANSVTPIPPYSTDNFTKCKVRLFKHDSTGTCISNNYTLTEGANYTSVYLYEGYHSLSSFNINFAGNNPDYGAVVYYQYNGN